jgi:hypothetical protein
MTADRLQSRPAWVAEGLAGHLADPSAALPPAGDCPRDLELLQPTSAGALADAYARARGCVMRQLRGGRDWTEVR